MDNLLEMKHIDKIFPGVKALDDVDFSVKAGEVHCLIGANGAGKSTLMKILSAAYTQDGGTIHFDGNQLKNHGTQARRMEGISVIYQELSLFNELTVAENVYMNNYFRKANGSIDWKKTYAETQALADSLNIKVNAKAKVSQLNIGQRQLTEIMKALACKAKLIVMDEPSSTLSQKEFEILVKVIKDLKTQGIATVYISHHLEELFIVGDRITVLRDGRFIDCVPTSSIDESQLVTMMTGANTANLAVRDGECHHVSDEVVLELKNVSNHKVSNVDLKLHKGEVLGLYGLVGSGRTEILQSIYGVVPLDEGEIYINGQKTAIHSPREAINRRIGLAPESRKTQGLVLILPVWENMSMTALRKFKRGASIAYQEIYKICDEYKERLKIKTPSTKTITQNLSGGNQQKVILAKWLMEDCDILLLDEPTQGIDVVAKSEIYKLIAEMTDQGKSIIVVSSELPELLSVCDNIHVMYDGQQVMTTNRADFNSDQILHASVIGRMA